MKKVKLIILYILFFSVLALGIYSVFQLIPEPEEEIPYEYDQQTPYKDPASDEIPELEYDFEGLLAQNEDFVGWLSIPNTTINFPVVMCEDNQHYLNYAFSGEWSVYGCPFLDNRTPLGGDNLVIHGHNMGSNQTEMFSPLALFQDVDYAKTHHMIHFARPDKEGEEYTLFAVVVVNIYDESLQYIFSNFDSPDDRTDFLSTIQNRSSYHVENIPSEGEILILSTCIGASGGDNRLLLVAIESNS